jgi:hypothetical protein
VTATSPHTADGSDASTLTIELRDAESNPVSGLSDGDFTLSGLGDASVTTISEPSSGTYEADLTNTTAEDVTVTVEASGTTLSDTPTVTFEAGAATTVAVATEPSLTTAGQPIAGPPTATVTDAEGNPVSGVDVTVSESDGYRFDGGTTTVTTDGSGRATFSDVVIDTAAAGYELARFDHESV